ncbi:MAG: DnaJ domain-containing protein [Cyanobacteria bacterium P01_E01_bin.6]
MSTRSIGIWNTRMDDILSYYKLLNIQPGATQEEVKQAYRKQAMLWHPDRFPDNPQKQQEAEERIKALNVAYAYLRDHDASQTPPSNGSTHSSSKPSRNASTSSNIRYQTSRRTAETYFQEGSDFAKAGDYQEAADALSVAIRLRSDYAEAYHLRSLMFSSLGFSHRAKSDKERARQIELENAMRSRKAKPTQRAQPQYANSESVMSTQPLSSWHCPRPLYRHHDSVTSLAFAQNGKLLISSSLDGAIYIWNIARGRQVSNLVDGDHAIHAVAVSSDSQFAASGGSDGTVKLWHLRTETLVHTFTGHTAPVLAVAFSPNRKVIVSGSDDGTVRFWHVQHRGVLSVLKEHQAAVRAIAINPNGLTLVSSDATHSIIQWDMQTRQCLQPSLGAIHDALALAFSPNRRDLLVGRLNGIIQRLDAETGEVIDQFEGHQQAVQSVAFTQTGRLFASGSGDRTVRLWSLDGEQVTLDGHDGSVNAVAFSPNGEFLASGSGDRTIRLWTNR